MGALQVLFLTICGGVWDNDAVGFYYDLNSKCSDVYRQLELYFTIALPAISICCYIAIIFILKKVKYVDEKYNLKLYFSYRKVLISFTVFIPENLNSDFLFSFRKA